MELIFELNYWETTCCERCFIDDGSSKEINLIVVRPNTKVQNEQILSWNDTYLHEAKYADVFET